MPLTQPFGEEPPPARAFGGNPATVVRSRDLLVDLGLVVGIAALFFGAVVVAREWAAPLDVAPPIDLDPRRLPVYTLFSMFRGASAFLLSLVFTIAYGKAAAASRKADRLMIPVLDILQSIPVLSFMPGLVLALVGLFPRSNLGLELACVLAIFTGQVWNMTFSFHASLRAIPTDVLEAARINGFGPLKRLFAVEIPSAMNGLVWNSMMSMAGGWFFLTIVEAFTLDGRTYRLPGLGSFMASAVEAGDGKAMAWALVAMVTMIVAIDQLVWRPLIVWAERFRNEETCAGERPRSWVYDLLRRSPLMGWMRARRRATNLGGEIRRAAANLVRSDRMVPRANHRKRRTVLFVALVAGVAGTFALVGAIGLSRLLARTSGSDWLQIGAGVGLTSVRVLGALLIGAAWTIPVGLLIGRSPKASRIAQPLIQVAASFPAPMLYPVVVPALIHAGLGTSVCATMLMMLGTQWYVLFNVAAGAKSVPQDLEEAAAAFRVPRVRRLLLVEFGSVFPYLVTGLVTAAGGAWNASIVSESVRFPDGHIVVDGIGSLIAAAFESGNTPVLAAATLTLAVALVLVNRLVWKPLQRLAATRFALNR